MKTIIQLHGGDSIRAHGRALVIADQDVDVVQLDMPSDAEQQLRLCDELTTAIEGIRHGAYSTLAGRS